MTSHYRLLLSLCFITFAGVSWGQEYIVWNGGISEEERAMAPSTGTRLVFFVSSGSYLAEIDVTVKNLQGEELVNVETDGPWLILDLPAGTYNVLATRGNGDVQSLQIAIGDDDAEFAFMFPGT